jgi:putative transcriptional regulator
MVHLPAGRNEMSKQVFEQINEALNEALAVARNQSEPYKLHLPNEIDVRAIRAKTGMTQKDFASAFGFGFDQLKQWEQGRVRPVQALRAYLMLIDDDPNGMLKALQRLHA